MARAAGWTRVPGAWVLVVVTAACAVLEALVMVRAGTGLWSYDAFRNAFPAANLATVVGALVGAVILSRHPRHPIGWLFGWGQAGVAVGLLTRALADAIISGELPAPAGAGRLTDLLANLLGSQFALVLLAALLLVAPDGRLISRRWRPFLALLPVAYGLIVGGLVLSYAAGSTAALEIVVFIGQLGIVAGLIAAVAALVVRLRRSSGETRQQLRWIMAAAAVLAAAPVLAYALNLSGLVSATPDWVVLVLQLGYLGVPVATGFAVLRYRLYDIDRLMGGSVVLAVLVVLALCGYVAAVAVIGVLLPGGSDNRWLSLLVFVMVVLAFQPIRRRVRRLADRLVYGPQSMSYDALSRFTRPLTASQAGQLFLPGVAEAAGLLVNASRCAAVVLLDDGTEERAVWISDALEPAASGSPQAGWTTTVVSQGVPVGRLEVEVPEFAAGAARRRELIGALAERLAEGFRHARLEASLRRRAGELDQLNRDLELSRRRVLAARDIGRRQVSTRITAEVVDVLAPLASELVDVAALAAVEPSKAIKQVDAALARTTSAIEALRQITSTVFSRLLAERGLAEALRNQASGAGMDLTVIGSPRWSPAVESCLYACCTDLLRVVGGPVIISLSAAEPGFARVSLAGASTPAGAEWLTPTRDQIEVLGGVLQQHAGQVVLRLPLIEAAATPTALSR